MNDFGGDAFPASLLLVGAGKMGGALLRGWLDRGADAARIFVIEPNPTQELQALCAARGAAMTLPQAPPEVIVLAIKPQMLDALAPTLAAVATGQTLLLSILAGKTIANLADRFPRARAIIRAMPNLAAAIGAGMTGAIANAAVTPGQTQIADRLLSAVGRVEWLSDESLVDAVTAVSGSGPAYVFYLTECLASAAVDAGIPADMAARLARATVEGAGALLGKMPALSPAELRQNVTSPGGTTAAALAVLMRPEGLDKLLAAAVAAAKRRAHDLSG